MKGRPNVLENQKALGAPPSAVAVGSARPSAPDMRSARTEM